MKRLAVLWLLSLSGQAFATSQNVYRMFPVLECPAIGDEYEKMISKLDSIKTSIKDSANCRVIDNQIDELENDLTTDRQSVLEIVEKARVEGTVTPEEGKVIREYSEKVTKKVAALSELFMRSNHCFQEDRPDNELAALAGFVGEASRLASSVAGPWGAPIALGGQVVAGFLTGLDQVLKSRSGYDFEKREQWMSYVQNLCTYHSFRDQIDHLLDPKGRISQLQELQQKLDVQLLNLSRRCTECQSIQDTYASIKHMGLAAIKAHTRHDVAAADQRFAKPLGTYTLHDLGLRDWLNNEISRLQREAASYWSDVSGRHLLLRAKDQIEEFLIRKEAPRFLNHQIVQIEKDYKAFDRFMYGEGRTLYHALNRAHARAITRPISSITWADSFDIFRTLVLSPIEWTRIPATQKNEDLKYSWTHIRDQSLIHFDTARTSTQVVQSFCSFFKHSGHYGRDIRMACTNIRLKQRTATQTKIEKEMEAAKVDILPRHPMPNPGLDSGADYSLNRWDALDKAIEMQGVGL